MASQMVQSESEESACQALTDLLLLFISHWCYLTTQNLGRNRAPHVACLIQGTMFLYMCGGLKKCDTGSHLLIIAYKLHTFYLTLKLDILLGHLADWTIKLKNLVLDHNN